MSSRNVLPYFSTEDSNSENEEDDDAEDRAAAFNQNKRMASRHSDKQSGSTGSIGRYDELGDYIARSERVRLEKEKPITEKEERKRKVRFRKATHNFVTVYDIPAITDEEKKKCFMGAKDWENIDKDVELTKMRWRNHKAGKIKFDYENNTLRGLEVVLNNQAKIARLQVHSNTVLEEAHRQKTSREYLNWDKLGAVSVESSRLDVTQAGKVGEKDAEASKAAWHPKPVEEGDHKFVKKEKEKKQRKGLFGLFKKKK